jgi:hypothetical protein
MPDTFAITIVFIILSTVVAAFIRRKSRDKCLKDFSHDLVTLEDTTGKLIWGKLRVENTGLELIYPTRQDKNGYDEMSYILYKYEYSNIQALIRFQNELSEGGKKEREKELKRTYHPKFLRRLKRKIQNVFKTVKDSVMEVVNLLISQAKRTTPAGAMLTSQDKYISQIKQELTGSMGTSFEPLLERYIGNRVVIELIKGEKIFKYTGVLKDYTAEFIEVMDVDYRVKEDKPVRMADIIVPRKYGIIRHLGE